jgi:uncharacterized membrane protein
VARSYNEIAARDLSRIAALSDGLFAIAMTLIVLEIRVPDPATITTDQQLWDALVALAPRFVTYLLSFLTLGIFWSAQHTQLSLFERGDRNLSWLELAFLAAVAITPFSTALLAEFIQLRLALVLYWANIALLGALVYACWAYADRAGLVRADVGPEVAHLIRRRIGVAQALYLVGMLLCVVNTYWSIAFIVLVQLFFAVAPRIPRLWRL